MTLSESLAQRKSSRLLQSFRAVGLIVDENPVITYRMGNETFLLASIKKAFVIYNCAKLTPVMVSPQLACKKISAMEVYSRKNLTFTASGRVIFVWKRLHQVTVLKGHKGDIQQVSQLRDIWLRLMLSLKSSFLWLERYYSLWTTQMTSKCGILSKFMPWNDRVSGAVLLIVEM